MFYKFGPPIAGSLFFYHHLWSLFLNNNTNTVRWRHHIRLMLQMMPPLFSLSLLVSSSSPTITALTDAMSESAPFFSCSDFRKEIFVDLKWKRFLAAARFEPSTFRSNTWRIRPQDHSILLFKNNNCFSRSQPAFRCLLLDCYPHRNSRI